MPEEALPAPAQEASVAAAEAPDPPPRRFRHGVLWCGCCVEALDRDEVRVGSATAEPAAPAAVAASPKEVKEAAPSGAARRTSQVAISM